VYVCVCVVCACMYVRVALEAYYARPNLRGETLCVCGMCMDVCVCGAFESIQL
jgi:hypothetical protein